MSLKDGRGLSGVRSEAGGVQPQEPKKKFAEDGFMVKFVLSKAYRGLERQENEMGRPTLKLRHRRRHRRHHRQDGAGNQGDGHVPKEGAGDGEQAGRRRSVLDKARDRLRARTSHHRDMGHRDVVYGAQKKDNAQLREIEKRGGESTQGQAVVEWMRRSQIRQKNVAERGDRLSKAEHPDQQVNQDEVATVKGSEDPQKDVVKYINAQSEDRVKTVPKTKEELLLQKVKEQNKALREKQKAQEARAKEREEREKEKNKPEPKPVYYNPHDIVRDKGDFVEIPGSVDARLSPDSALGEEESRGSYWGRFSPVKGRSTPSWGRADTPGSLGFCSRASSTRHSPSPTKHTEHKHLEKRGSSVAFDLGSVVMAKSTGRTLVRRMSVRRAEPEPAEEVLRTSRYLYDMCQCQKVSKPETLTALRSRRKVSGVIEVHGCDGDNNSPDGPTVCPFCQVFPEHRIQGWMKDMEESENPDPYPKKQGRIKGSNWKIQLLTASIMKWKGFKKRRKYKTE